MDNLRYLPRQAVLSNGSGNSTLPRPPSNPVYAAERADFLFRQYRTGQANDPDVYVASIAAILTDYPNETIRYVTDPRTGIAANPPPDPETGRTWTGMPNPADVKRACETHYGPERRRIERDRQALEQLNERKMLTFEPKKKTYSELVADCNAKGLQIGPKPAVPLKAKEIDDFKAQHGISQAAWDAIPNGPRREA